MGLFLNVLSTISFVFGISSLAYAQLQVGTEAPKIVNELILSGFKQIGALDLVKLEKEIQEVQWTVIQKEAPYEIAGLRRSAFYTINDKKVSVTLSATREPVENLKLLELHEALGALGYRDGNYSQTTALKMLTAVKDQALKQKLIEIFGATIFNDKNLKAARGGSSVGGGGDSEALVVKNRIFDELLKSGTPLMPEFYVEYLEINFEPWDESEGQHVWAQYEVASRARSRLTFPSARQDNKFYEILTFFYPSLLWKKPELQEKILSEITGVLLAVFPAFKLKESVLVRPGGCPAEAQLRYPKTTDRSARLIQNARVRIRFGCEPLDEGVIYVTSPRWILKADNPQ